jgi:PTH2 family peptidyl-tRNA hydrolase
METHDKVKQVIVMRTKYPDGKGGTRKLRTGKMIAQGAHASMAFLTRRLCVEDQAVLPILDFNGNPIVLDTILRNSDFRRVHLTQEEQLWIEHKFTKICVYVETEEELLAVHQAALDAGLTASLIQDAGDTEFDGQPTYTAVGIGPHLSSKLKPVTGHLPLL